MTSRIRALLADRRIRFLLVGGTNVAVGYTIFGLLHLFVLDGLRFGYLLSLAIAYAIVIVMGFVLYRRLVFDVEGTPARDFGYYVAVNLVTFGLNAALLAVLVETLGLHALVGQAIALVVTTLISYVGHSRLSFGRPS